MCVHCSNDYTSTKASSGKGMKPILISFDELVSSIPFDALREYSPDIVIAVERGGLVLGSLLSLRLNADFLTIKASFYDESKPARAKYEEPKISGNIFPSMSGKKVLIVDDVSKSGKTLSKVKEKVKALDAADIRTFVFAGNADFNSRSFEQCLIFPWE
jgi:hypoxanthine phosphoribosyltransferase